MGRSDKLLRNALEAPNSMRFDDLCSLAQEYGYEYRRTTGSHRIYKRKGVGIMDFQDDGGKAKPYQVKQLLDKLRELGEIE